MSDTLHHQQSHYFVPGARGLVGRATVAAAEAQGAAVTAVSRNPPEFKLAAQTRFVSCDLTDREH